MISQSEWGPDAAAGPGPTSEVLALEHVTKTYPGVRALTDVSLVCRAGEIHALVGENGSGKSTLVKVASGIVAPDAGRVVVAGRRLAATPLACRRAGILTAYQDTSLVPGLTVAENVVVSYSGTRRQPLRLDVRGAQRLLEPFELGFRPDAVVADLSPGARQLLDVVRALIHHPRVLLLDEPTAALDADKIATLERLLTEARDRGTAIVYISHRLDEVQRFADRLTVLRDGVVQGSYDGGAWSVAEIVELMVGVPTELEFPPKPPVAEGAPVALSTRALRGSGFGPVDVEVRAGEVVGIAAAEGNGQRQLLRALIGLQPSRGDVIVAGAARPIRTPRSAAAAGVAFQSGDRVAESMFRGLSVMANATLPISGELGPFATVMRRREAGRFAAVAERLRIVHATPDQPVDELSGGNQQKAVMARSVLKPAPVLVVDEPTQGVDARARLDIYEALADQVRAGTALLLCSSDSAELAGLCHRVHAISRGRVVATLEGDELTEANIVSAFVNAEGGAAAVSPAAAQPSMGRRVRDWLFGRTLGASAGPLVLLALLIVALGAYTAARSDVFLTESNLYHLLLATLPLAVVAIGQQCCLISGGFDISVGSTMSVAVVVASFVATGGSVLGAAGAALLVLLVGAGIGLANALVVRGIGIDPLIATIATLGILQGVAIWLRPTSGGLIGDGLVSLLDRRVGFVPIALVVVVAVAVAAEVWMMKTSTGLLARASGASEEAARRNGVRVSLIKVGGYVASGVLAAAAGLLLSVQVGVGDNSVGSAYALLAFAACFLGGAALTGGRGSFVGAVLGALFLSLLTNVAPLLDYTDATSQVASGVLTLIAVAVFSVRRRAGR